MIFIRFSTCLRTTSDRKGIQVVGSQTAIHIFNIQFLAYPTSIVLPSVTCSTQDALLKTVDDWIFAIDCGEGVGAVLVDLSKVFDTSNHGPLLDKLAANGIHNEEHRWFSNYLIDRVQRVSVYGAYSELCISLL